MLKYRGSQLARAGFIGVVLIILVIAIPYIRRMSRN